MNKTELENAIKNGESVWYLFGEAYELKTSEHTNKFITRSDDYCYTDKSGVDRECPLDMLYKSRGEAEHYLHHANVSRTETLPFLTWEEFKNKYKDVVFTDPKGVKYYLKKCVFWCPETNNVEYCISIKYGENYLTKIEYDYTEQDFYKAYDECARLFKGGEDE